MEGKKNYFKESYKTSEKTPAYNPKRGPLSKLMTEEAKATASIHELSYDFACRITRLFQYLTEDAEYKELFMVQGSGTSQATKSSTRFKVVDEHESCE